MKALISGNRVCEVVEDDKEFPVHDSMQWVDCDASVKADDMYVDGEFVKREEEEASAADIARNKMPSTEEQLGIICDALANLSADAPLSVDALKLIMQHQELRKAK